MKPTRAGQKLLDTFDRIVVINLAHRPDRLREIGEQLARVGLSFDHPAVLRFDACRYDDAADFPTRGTRGCFHSHLGVWRDAKARGDKAVLLFEDDLDFVADIEERLPAALDAASTQDWSIFYGAVLQWTPAEKPASTLAQAQPGEPIMGGHFIAMRGDALDGIADYLDVMAQRAAGSPEGGPMHVDGAYGWYREANPAFLTFVAQPNLGCQRSSRTDIHRLGLKDRLPIVRDVVARLRQVRRRL